MNFEYRNFLNEDLLLVHPSLYKRELNKVFSPTQENTITILHNDKIVAFLDCSYRMDRDVVVWSIDLFEVFDFGKGIGSQIIKEIQQCEEMTCIEVIPYSPRSVRFWEKMRFKFIDNETMQWKKGQENEIT